MADDNSTQDIIENEQRDVGTAERKAREAGSKAKEKARQEIKKAAKAKKKGQYIQGLGKIIWPIIGVVVIIIMIIGFLSFAINMPGTVVDKIMSGVEKSGLTLMQRFKEEDLSYIIPEDLKEKKLNMLNYLKDMGYDVVGMGFVQSITETQNEDKTKTVITDFNEDITLNGKDPEEHVTNYSGNTIQPSYLFSYYVANERMYVAKNLKLINSVLKLTGVNSTWGEGMLNIYGDTSAVDNNEVDRENLTLTFKNTHGFFMTDVYQYNIDGWSGRYGTPLELLLAIHSSTMMPDLAYEFVSNPNLQTVVNIDAQEVKLKVKLKLKKGNEEQNIDAGKEDDPPVPIEFVRDSQTNEYRVNNIEEISQGLREGQYTVSSLYHGFEAFENTLNEQATAIGADATQRKIEELINMNKRYFYTTFNPDDTNTLFGSYYLGTVDELYNGATLYDGLVTVNSVDKVNRKVNYTTGSGNREDALCKMVALPYIADELKKEADLMDWSPEDKYSDGWKQDIHSSYAFIFESTDIYIGNLLEEGMISEDKLVYREDYKYSKRFEDWANGIQKPMEFNEYIESNGFQGLNQYEKEGKYKNYLSDWADEQVRSLNDILRDIQSDLNVERDLKAIANRLKENLANQLGLTLEQVNVIYKKFVEGSPVIQTFVPQIKSVVKHWYKDLIFQYKNTAKGSVFISHYPGTCVPGYDAYYEFETLDDKYPVQDGEPYVIKGDVITQNGKQVEKSDFESQDFDTETNKVINDYKLGTGYKTARKLFTQGYYYQYDGSKETTEEIANAKRIEAYTKGTPLKVIVKNSRLYVVKQTSEQPIGTELHRYADKENHDVATRAEATFVYDTYYIAAPGPYVSPVEEEPIRSTEESVKEINDLLKKLGTGLRRKKVTMSSNTTSLSALAMLEGMHSLDADYIYREFKEFLIELGYYSRAEIESVETNVLDWFIPAFTPDQWPPVKTDEEMLEYGVTLTSSQNIKEKEVLDVNKVANLDNFIFFTDTDGVYNNSTLQGQGNNVRFINNVNADAIVDEIVNSNPAAICLYVNGNAKDDSSAIVKTKQLIVEIRAKLKEKNYKAAELPIYVLKVLPLEEPDLMEESSKAVVDQNKRISDYNTSLYSVCLNQNNVKFIDATNGCVTERGWLSPDCSNNDVSANIIKKIVQPNVSNGGFEEGLDVVAPGAGYIKKVTEDEITIEFSADKDHKVKSIDKFTMVIKGIAVSPELIGNFNSSSDTDTEGNKVLNIESGATIGLTTTQNIKLILRDRNKAIIGNIEDYMNLPKKEEHTGSDLGKMEDVANFILYFEGGLNSNVEGDNWVVIPDLNNPGDWHANTAGGSGITNWCEEQFNSTGHGDLWPMQIGDRVPISAILEVKAAVTEAKFAVVDQYLADYGISDWGLDQKAAFISLMYNGYSDSWGPILQAYANGNMKQFVNIWMSCGNLAGHFKRRAVELDLFFTGNYETSEARKTECLEKYSNY